MIVGHNRICVGWGGERELRQRERERKRERERGREGDRGEQREWGWWSLTFSLKESIIFAGILYGDFQAP